MLKRVTQVTKYENIYRFVGFINLTSLFFLPQNYVVILSQYREKSLFFKYFNSYCTQVLSNIQG